MRVLLVLIRNECRLLLLLLLLLYDVVVVNWMIDWALRVGAIAGTHRDVAQCLCHRYPTDLDYTNAATASHRAGVGHAHVTEPQVY